MTPRDEGGKRVTAEERTEKIRQKLAAVSRVKIEQGWFDYIAFQLDAARSEGREEESARCRVILDKMIDKSFKEGREEGREYRLSYWLNREQEAYAKGREEGFKAAAKTFDNELELLQSQFEASRGVAVKRDLDICLRHRDRILELRPMDKE